MRSHIDTRTSSSRIRLAGIALFALGFLAEGAPAQIVVAGDARGCFGYACTPMDTDKTDVNGVWLKYSSVPTFDFGGITSGGLLAINTHGTSTTGNFGLLMMGTPTESTVFNTPFTLSLGFINPSTPHMLFNAVVSGYIASNGTGGVIAFFNPTALRNTFHDPSAGLSGDLHVTPLSTTLRAGGITEIQGMLKVENVVPSTVTPEPVTVVLLGSGLVGLAVARRRRKLT